MADCEASHVIQATGPFRITAEGMHFRARENGLHNPPVCGIHQDNQAGRSQTESSLRRNHGSMRPAVAGIPGSINRPPSMSYRYTLIRPEELAAAGEMEPAVVLRISLAAIANALAERIGTIGFNPIVSDRDRDAMYVRVDNVPLVFVSFNEEPSEVHVYVEDRNVQGKGSLVRLLALLPLSGVAGDWWTRDDQPRWPGNGADTFIIGQ